MKINLYSNKLLREDNALEVKSSNFFKNGVPDPEGLFSPIIFGTTPEEKEHKIGFIDLKSPFIHPLFYMRIGQRTFRKIDSLIQGTEKFSVVKGKLVPDPNGNTGLKWFISVLPSLDMFTGDNVNEGSSMLTKELRGAMKSLTLDDVLMWKYAVTPLAFRDFSTLDMNASAVDEANNLYRDLIRLVSYQQENKNNALFDINMMNYKIQMKANAIFDYFEGRTFKKYGAQNMLVLARNIDYSARLVISAVKHDPNTYGSNWVKMDTCGAPLSAVAGTCILYALNAAPKIIERIYNSNGFANAKGEQPSLEDLKNEYFNNEKVAEIIDTYIWSWGERLNYIKKPNSDEPVTFTYKDHTGKEFTKNLTMTEFVYMLVYENIEVNQICAPIRRYPIQGAFSIISLKIHIMTIDEVKKIEFGGCEYPYFPDTGKYEKQIEKSKDINVDKRQRAIIASKISSKYDETLILSNLLMDGYNMDFDGDKVAFTPHLTKQSNDEALAFLKDPQAYFSIEGNNQRIILNKESISGIYGLTCDSKEAKKCNDKEVLNNIINSCASEFNTLVKYTLDDYDENTMKIKPSEYKIESPCVYKNENTTIGRMVFNIIVTNRS